mgnify:CR=1 FL=1
MYYAVMTDNIDEVYKFFNTAKTNMATTTVILPEKKTKVAKNEQKKSKTENVNEYTVKDLSKMTGRTAQQIYEFVSTNRNLLNEHKVRKGRMTYYNDFARDYIVKYCFYEVQIFTYNIVCSTGFFLQRNQENINRQS